MANKIRRETQQLLDCFMGYDVPPPPNAAADFGITSLERFNALRLGVMTAQITPQQLDEAMCNGPKLTALVHDLEGNPFPEVHYETPWDRLLEAVRDPSEERSLGGNQLSRQVRPVTRHLLDALQRGDDPSPAAQVDFGIDSPAHHQALACGVRSGQLTARQLDAALGNGRQLTGLVNEMLVNPCPGIVFRTAYDSLRAQEGEREQPYAEQLDDQEREL